MRFSSIQQMFRNYCLIEKGMTSKHYRTITRHMERILEFYNTDKIRKVTESNIRGYLSEESQTKLWTPKTYRSHLQSFNTFFKWAEKTGYNKKNPAEKIEKPKLPHRLPRCLTKSEMNTVLDHAVQYEWLYKFERIRNITILYTFIYTGLRLNELLKLRITDVNLEAQEIYVNHGKGGKNRSVPIHPKLLGTLRGYIEHRNARKKISQWFFTGIHSDKRLYEKNVQEFCKKISISSGIKFTPHMLRHTFARLSCDADMNIFKLKEIMGHSHVNTTQIYLSVSKEGIKKSFGSISLL